MTVGSIVQRDFKKRATPNSITKNMMTAKYTYTTVLIDDTPLPTIISRRLWNVLGKFPVVEEISFAAEEKSFVDDDSDDVVPAGRKEQLFVIVVDTELAVLLISAAAALMASKISLSKTNESPNLFILLINKSCPLKTQKSLIRTKTTNTTKKTVAIIFFFSSRTTSMGKFIARLCSRHLQIFI